MAGKARKAKPDTGKARRKGRAQAPAPTPAAPADARNLCVVGIGASAGGFDAICELLQELPSDSGLSFVVVQHLSPTQKSLAAELFAKRTQMAVLEASDGLQVRPNTVYTLPPDTYAGIQGGALRLVKPPEPRGRRLPIDAFFRSLAADQKQRAIGVILSGTGTDGTLGLKHIVAEGGIVVVQAPDTAQFDGMPRAALSTGLATHVLTVAQMPELLVEWARHPYATAAEGTEQAEQIEAGTLDSALEVIRARHGYNFHGYKHRMLVRRIRRRMGLRRIERMGDYIAALRRDPHEVDALFRDLLIGVTEFFRDPEAWAALEHEAIDALVRSQPEGMPIRAWVSGAATGEEGYSLAMLLLEKLKDVKKHCPVQVFATDTNEEAIAAARAGIYPAGIAAHVSPDRLQRFFTDARNDHHYEVTRELREAVIFGVHNLFSDPPFSRMDLITCRNLLIYLEPESQRRVVTLFHVSLRPGGVLFLGPAETVGPRDDLFRVASRKWRIYRRTGTTPRDDRDWQLESDQQRAVYQSPFTARRARGAANMPANLAQQIILDRFAPASALVNSKFEVLYFCGPTERYLSQPRGVPTKDLLMLARDGLRTQLRNGVREADSRGEPVVLHDLRVRRGASFEMVRVTITPAAGEPEDRPLLVVFEDEPRRVQTEKSRRRADAGLLRQLEDELRATKDDLQTSIARLETSNEELRVSHEEVVSANEELQSANEEMESSKEELQSLNEELNTVNQQLQGKIAELESTNNDLRNLLASSDIATICLDRDLRIKWFTPSTRNVLKVIQTDVGRPISDLGSPLAGESLVRDARTVLASLTPVQADVLSERDRWYTRRTLPYRTEDDRIDGVIATFSDVTDARRTTELRLEAKDAAADVLEQRVEDRTRQLRGLASELALAEERERRAVARDLHDDLGQVLNLARFKLDRLVRNAGDTVGREGLEEVDRLISQAHQSARSLVFQLSPPILEELGLVPALQWLGEEMQHAYGLHVDLRHEGDAPTALSQATRSILFRAVRELLINVAKHAHADSAKVRLRTGDKSVEVVVSDEGVGFRPELLTASKSPGLGLLHLRERLSYIGGVAEIRSEPGHGTVARLEAPLENDQTSGRKP